MPQRVRQAGAIGIGKQRLEMIALSAVDGISVAKTHDAGQARGHASLMRPAKPCPGASSVGCWPLLR
jgi:hypothetical protein